MKLTLGKLAVTAAASSAALLLPAGLAQAKVQASKPDGSITCWQSPHVKVHGVEVPWATSGSTVRDKRISSCSLTPLTPFADDAWQLKAPDGISARITIKWDSAATATREASAGRMTCYTDPELRELNPYVSLDGAYPGRKATTCTLTPRIPLASNRWTLTAPNGRSSVVTISGD